MQALTSIAEVIRPHARPVNGFHQLDLASAQVEDRLPAPSGRRRTLILVVCSGDDVDTRRTHSQKLRSTAASKFRTTIAACMIVVSIPLILLPPLISLMT